MTDILLTDTRSGADVCRILRSLISNGELGTGDLVPSVRELSSSHGVARATAHRALKQLASEGLIAPEPRRGYRVLGKANDPAQGRPIAYVLQTPDAMPNWDDFHQHLFGSIQATGRRRGWNVIGMGGGGQKSQDIIEELRAARVSGVVLDAVDEELVSSLARINMPVVLVDAFDPKLETDSVVQDSFNGAMAAAEWIAGRGHKKVAWLGLKTERSHACERFGGAVTGLAKAGVELTPDMRTFATSANGVDKAMELLSRPKRNRPTAILALWRDFALDVAIACRNLELTLGEDLELVGWSSEQQYERGYRRFFEGGSVPPAVVWSAEEMVEAALARLADRRANPDMAPMRINVPARLHVGSGS